MHVSRPATSGAHRQFTREMRLCSGRECACLLIAHANPLDIVAGANRIRHAIERIARNSVNSLNACTHQDVYQQISHSLCHCHSLPNLIVPELARVLTEDEGERMEVLRLQYETSSAEKRGRNYAVRSITFSNPSASLDHRRCMPWKPVCHSRSERAPGRRVLRLDRREASEIPLRPMLVPASHPAGRSRPARELPACPAYQRQGVECGGD